MLTDWDFLLGANRRNFGMRQMMIAKYMLQIFLTFGITSVTGFVNLTCSSSRVVQGDPLTCTCTTDSTTGIDWQNDGGSFLLCFSGSGACTTVPAGFEVENNGTSKVFQITIKSFSYTNCGNIICKDQAGSDAVTESLSLYAFNASVPASISENVQSDSGEISITTDCLYRKEEIKTIWFTISKGKEKKYTPDSSYSIPSPCASDVCGAETAYTLKNGFKYTKATKNPLKVKFKVKMYHESNTSIPLELTTADDYYIQGSTTTSPPVNATTISTATNPPTTTPKHPCDRSCIIIVPIVAVVVTVSVCAFVCCWLRLRRNNNKKERSKEINSNQSYDNDIVKKSDTTGYKDNE